MDEFELVGGVFGEAFGDGDEGIHVVFWVGSKHGSGGADREPEVSGVGYNDDLVVLLGRRFEIGQGFEEAMSDSKAGILPAQYDDIMDLGHDDGRGGVVVSITEV